MKERLIELLNGAVDEVKQTCGGVNTIADYLLENGVIVLPCKIGDYVEWDNGISKYLWQVKGFSIDSRVGLRYELDICQPMVTHRAIKRIIPREQAQAKLKEGGDR
jgi:hypothetical protein